MKKIYFYLLLLITTNIYAENSPNFNNNTRVIDIPMITVDHQETFKEVKVLLDSNGQWQILSAKPEQEQEQESLLVGRWKGIVTDGSYFQALVNVDNNDIKLIAAGVVYNH